MNSYVLHEAISCDLQFMITFILLDIVRGSGEANVLLSSCECSWGEDCPAKDCDGYEIVIGAHNNTKSVIREHKQRPVSPYSFIYVSKSINYHFVSPLY